jgi:hypothetical protein
MDDPIMMWALRIYMSHSHRHYAAETPMHPRVEAVRGQALLNLVMKRTGGLQ